MIENKFSTRGLSTSCVPTLHFSLLCTLVHSINCLLMEMSYDSSKYLHLLSIPQPTPRSPTRRRVVMTLYFYIYVYRAISGYIHESTWTVQWPATLERAYSKPTRISGTDPQSYFHHPSPFNAFPSWGTHMVTHFTRIDHSSGDHFCVLHNKFARITQWPPQPQTHPVD